MTNNDILKRLRYALNFDNVTMIEMFRRAGVGMTQSRIDAMMKKDEEEGFEHCPRSLLGSFLDGFVAYRRGPRPDSGSGPKKNLPLTNNVILRKLKIAMELRDEDIVAIMQLAGDDVSKAEISALLQKPDHKNYKECRDQFLRTFIKGLTLYTRKDDKS